VATGLKSVDASSWQISMGFRPVLGFDGPALANILNLHLGDGWDNGGISLDLFIFTVDETDQVVEVSIRYSELLSARSLTITWFRRRWKRGRGIARLKRL
jgi:hypothetical protein